MRKWTAGFVATALLVISLAGCGGGQPAAGDKAEPKGADQPAAGQPEPKQSGGAAGGQAAAGPKQVLTFSTGQVGGAWFTFTAPMSQVMNKYLKGYNINVVPGGAVENMRILADGQAQLVISSINTGYIAKNGIAPFTTKIDVMPVATLFSTFGHVFTLKSTGIKSIADLKGKRVAVGPAGSVMIVQNGHILEAYGMKMTDIKPQYLQTTQVWDALKDGQIDAAMFFGDAPTAAIQQLGKERELVFLPVEKDKMDAILQKNPYYIENPIPANTYPGQTSDVRALGFVAQIYALGNTPADLVYEFTGKFHQGLKEMEALSPRAKEITNKTITQPRTLPFHPAAIKYYQEAKIW